MSRGRILQWDTSSSMHLRALLTSTRCRKEGGCSGLAEVVQRNDSLLIVLACRCGSTKVYLRPRERSASPTLGGSVAKAAGSTGRPTL